jgi:hypothetical protein
MANILTWSHVNSQDTVIYTFVTEVVLLWRFTSKILTLRLCVNTTCAFALPRLGLQRHNVLTGNYKTLTYQTKQLKLL